MSTQDIIEAATPGPWEVRGCVVPGEAIDYCYKDGNASIRLPVANTGVCDSKRLNPKSDARFIATFDPEHVALMEAVCEAAADYLQDTCNECGFRTCEMPDSDIGCSLDDIRNTRAALAAYRKERGL